MFNVLQKVIILFLLSNSMMVFADSHNKELTDDEIVKSIIKKSIASYPGQCPCPYSSDKNGNNCGDKSAYTKTKGYSPICYESDVNKKMIERYKDNKQNQAKEKIDQENADCGCGDSSKESNSKET